MTKTDVHLSLPDIRPGANQAVNAAIESGWVSTVGPDVEAFENDLARMNTRAYAMACSSGTSGLHLAMLALGIGLGARVAIPTSTFAASAFAASYVGAVPVFIDAEPEAYTIDCSLLQQCVEESLEADAPLSAVVSVDAYGTPSNNERIAQICDRYSIPWIVDGAQSLGSLSTSKPSLSFGDIAVTSFNGNKIVSAGGGGAVLTDNAELDQSMRNFANQSRQPVSWYEHHEVGYNYRMSNLLCALGREQLLGLASFVETRRQRRELYHKGLDSEPNLSVMADPSWGASNAWLSVVTFSGPSGSERRDKVRRALKARGIESRVGWKPLHSQPVFHGAKSYLNGVSEAHFNQTLCLPSGAGVDSEVIDDVVSVIRTTK